MMDPVGCSSGPDYSSVRREYRYILYEASSTPSSSPVCCEKRIVVCMHTHQYRELAETCTVEDCVLEIGGVNPTLTLTLLPTLILTLRL